MQKARVKRTDLQILSTLLEDANKARLGAPDRKAFDSMRERLLTGKQINLSAKQREWVERRYFDLDLDRKDPTDNPTPEKVTGLALTDSAMGPMVVKPPGRR